MKKYFLLLSLFITGNTYLFADDFTFSKDLNYNGQSYRLLNQTTFIKGFFFKVFEAGLYVQKEFADPYSFGDKRAIAIKIQYYRSISADKLNQAGRDILNDLFTIEQNNRFKNKLIQIEDSMKSVTEGDYYILYYSPDRGLSLTFNDQFLAEIEGDSFANYYLSIWLGNHKSTKSIKDGLLNLD